MTLDERAGEIYKTYIDVICPYILNYEILTGSFPIALLNEIRAIFTHLSKYHLANNDKIRESNISKAEGHIKRSILDCYKYICIAYDDEYRKYEKKYERIDKSFVDNGEFARKLLDSYHNAVNLIKKARKTDFLINSDEEINIDEAYKNYQEAFIAYSSVYELLNNSYKKLDYLKKKAIFKDFFTIGIGIIGILGTIFTIVSFFIN